MNSLFLLGQPNTLYVKALLNTYLPILAQRTYYTLPIDILI